MDKERLRKFGETVLWIVVPLFGAALVVCFGAAGVIAVVSGGIVVVLVGLGMTVMEWVAKRLRR